MISLAPRPSANVKAVPTKGAEQGVASRVTKKPVMNSLSPGFSVFTGSIDEKPRDSGLIKTLGICRYTQPNRLAAKNKIIMHEMVKKTGS